MCHEQFHRARAWDREMTDEDGTDDPLADEATDDLPPFLNDDEPDEDVEVLTDGGP